MRDVACRICGGKAVLGIKGELQQVSPEQLAPSTHTPGCHGDLFRCQDCATVVQPALPDAAALQDLYREMSDQDYLAEEAGRRETARGLLDLIGEHVPSGSLLDVGCGHGLLLDEARSRGYTVRGLELSQASARYARDELCLNVDEITLDGLSEADRFEVIVLADVIEHVDDPVAIIDVCARVLLPGGVLCVVTPDPSSLTARIAGSRWWSYLPGHTYLLPRRTLRELLSASGLVISHDKQLVRTFSARRWIDGLAERVPVLSSLLTKLGRLVGDRLALRLSLRDERVILAHRAEVEHAPEPILRDRNRPKNVHIVLPSYRATRTIPSVAQEMPRDGGDRALLVDDASPDPSVSVALSHGFDTLRHPLNRGYGASQKTGYVRSLLDGADVIVMVHADNQYDPALVPVMAEPIVTGRADVVIGSRLLDDRAIAGGMPRWKWLGNRFLTTIENKAFGIKLSEYHTGYRAFSAEFLRSVAFLRNSDEFVFDQEIFAQIVHLGARVEEIPIPTRYFHEASSVNLLTSIRYGLKTLYVLARFRLHRSGIRWNQLGRPAATLSPVEEREAAVA